MALNDKRRASRTDASESWDNDFEFQSSAPSPTSEHYDPIANTSRHIATASGEDESWDDAYEDEEGDAHERIQVAPTRESDVDTASWGSGSDWSGDGDAEDFSHESYTRTSSEPPEPRSPALPSGFLNTLHSPAAAAPTPTPPSFFSRLSPVKKWKAREMPRSDKSRGKEKGIDATEKKGAKWLKRRRSMTMPANNVHPQPVPVKRVFSSTNLPLSQQTRHSGRPALSPNKTTRTPYLSPPPITPDLAFSPSSASSPADTPPPLLSPTLRPIPNPGLSRVQHCSSVLVPEPTSIRLSVSSTHNLPSTADQHASLITTRRSSLGDLKRSGSLKIPDRIFRAQRDIKRDMSDVKEFAVCIEQLKNLRYVYTLMLRDLRETSTTSPSSSPKKHRRGIIGFSSPHASPTKLTRKFSFAAPPSPIRDRLTGLDATYGVWWECADLLISLGRPQDADEAHTGMTRGRPRAVTLGSGSDVASPSKGIGPPPTGLQSSQWRATTGHVGPRDFTPRQLALLRGMLAAEAGEAWDPRATMVRVRESALDGSMRDKWRGTGGGLGIRDLWRGFRKGVATEPTRPWSSGDSSASEGSAFAQSGTSSPSPSKRTVTAATNTAVLTRRRQPARRPSLAGIFGLGQRTSSSPKPDAVPSHTDESSDWDADRPAAETIRATVRKQRKHKDGLVLSPGPTRESSSSPQKPSHAPVLRTSRHFLTFADGSPSASDSPKRKRLFSNPRSPSRRDARSLTYLALTPENIRPLLRHAREVSARLNECISEVREMLSGTSCS